MNVYLDFPFESRECLVWNFGSENEEGKINQVRECGFGFDIEAKRLIELSLILSIVRRAYILNC